MCTGDLSLLFLCDEQLHMLKLILLYVTINAICSFLVSKGSFFFLILECN